MRFSCASRSGRIALAVLWVGVGSAALAQTPKPVNDNLNTPLPIAPASTPQGKDSTLESPSVPDPTDRSTESSPVSPERRGAAFPVGAVVSVTVVGRIDSGGVKNGDEIGGVLKTPVKNSAGVTYPAGTQVTGTVVSAAKAGTVASGGVLSLQLTRVGPVRVVTDVLDFSGKEGHKDVADAAPDKGTEAAVQDGALLQFHVMENGPVPGIVKGANLNQINGGPTVGSPQGTPHP